MPVCRCEVMVHEGGGQLISYAFMVFGRIMVQKKTNGTYYVSLFDLTNYCDFSNLLTFKMWLWTCGGEQTCSLTFSGQLYPMLLLLSLVASCATLHIQYSI